VAPSDLEYHQLGLALRTAIMYNIYILTMPTEWPQKLCHLPRYNYILLK